MPCPNETFFRGGRDNSRKSVGDLFTARRFSALAGRLESSTCLHSRQASRNPAASIGAVAARAARLRYFTGAMKPLIFIPISDGVLPTPSW